MGSDLVSVQEASKALNVSLSTVWRMLRRGSLPSVRSEGRRLIPSQALRRRLASPSRIGALRKDHPIFRLVGAGRSGGAQPGARDKYAILAP